MGRYTRAGGVWLLEHHHPQQGSPSHRCNGDQGRRHAGRTDIGKQVRTFLTHNILLNAINRWRRPGYRQRLDPLQPTETGIKNGTYRSDAD